MTKEREYAQLETYFEKIFTKLQNICPCKIKDQSGKTICKETLLYSYRECKDYYSCTAIHHIASLIDSKRGLSNVKEYPSVDDIYFVVKDGVLKVIIDFRIDLKSANNSD